MGADGSTRSNENSTRKTGRKRRIAEEEIDKYLAKKAQKKATKLIAKELAKSRNISGYVDESNPFGDSNLSERFVWRKKIERDIAQGVPIDAYSLKEEKKKHRERMAEVEKAKKRREEKAMERAQREIKMALLARESARAEFENWEKKEDEFDFNQGKPKSEIRLREGRAKPIDILLKHLNPSDDDELDVEINEPCMVFNALNVEETMELGEDIKLHLELDRATPVHARFWEALMVVCDWELGEARKKDALDRAKVRGEWLPLEKKGTHSIIEEEVKNFLQEKSYAELKALQSQIESEMRSGRAKVVEFWESLLKHLHIFKAKAFLKEMREKPLEILSSVPELYEETQNADLEAVSFSPQLFHGDDNEEAIDPEEDKAMLERKRLAVLQERRLLPTILHPSPEDDFEKRALRAMAAMDEDDATFGSNHEVNLYLQYEYLPRKPKYFNRVHTGYEWNKYNRNHYDHENPPPKFVQGYKFNIFYPNLINNGETPTYILEKDGESTETIIIKFHAGPPYEDIAFRIVNKDWEKGSRQTFERGILRLYFNFKRYRYRR